MFESLWDSGATAHQVLALARDYRNLTVELVVPDVATVEDIPFTEAMRTGGKSEPRVFVHMFDAAMESLAAEWEMLVLGFRLYESGDLVANVSWVDNTFL